ncbi:MAG: ATP-dependent acyl-CoA ligase, partial [Ilumatobacteraceae bacterium]|nr:ATP-dependent acyl-CoA ligase [Ilumatobacteraceae bacterium]
LPRFMQPRFIEFVDVLPRTSTEKLDKKQLRARGVSASAWDRDASATARAPSAVHG